MDARDRVEENAFMTESAVDFSISDGTRVVKEGFIEWNICWLTLRWNTRLDR